MNNKCDILHIFTRWEYSISTETVTTELCHCVEETVTTEVCHCVEESDIPKTATAFKALENPTVLYFC